jgi:DNA modification methylase
MKAPAQGSIHHGADPPAIATDCRSRTDEGNVLEVVGGLPEASVQTVVTSPPYWGLRDYDLPATVWGGEKDCAHRWGGARRGPRGDDRRACRGGRQERSSRQKRAGREGGDFCLRCGAWRGCLGLEPDPDLYVDHLVEVMRGVRRCLRPDGTLWLNLGDSFAANRIGAN